MTDFKLFGVEYKEVSGARKFDCIVYKKLSGETRFYFHPVLKRAYVTKKGNFVALYQVYDSGKAEYKNLNVENVQYFKAVPTEE